MAAPKKRNASLSDAEIQQIIDQKDAENTQNVVKKAVKLFNMYCKEKGIAEVDELSTSELDDVLGRFYAELRKQNGDLYAKKSLESTRYGLQRHLDTTRNVDIIKDKAFKHSNLIYKSMLVKLKDSGKAKVQHSTGFFVLQHIIGVGAIPEYFDTHFDTAVAIYCCGTGLGITVMPLITQALRDIYGWRGTLILLSGLCAHSIPCGALINIDKKKAHKRTEDNTSLIKTEQQEYSSISECFKSISEILDLSLLNDIYFIAQILVPAFIKGFTFNGWLIYIVSFALSNGASYKEASFIATCGGIGLTAIRAFLPILHKILTFKQFIYLQSVLATISLLLMTQFVSIAGMATMSVIYGISFGILGAEMFIVIREVTNPSQHYSGVAWYSVFDGTGTVAGGFLTGYLFDMTGSFTISFTVLAVVSLMTAVCFGLVDIWDRIKRTKFAPL